MASNQRIDEFLRLQDKGISLDEIASTLGVKPQTLRRNLNKPVLSENAFKNSSKNFPKDKVSMAIILLYLTILPSIFTPTIKNKNVNISIIAKLK